MPLTPFERDLLKGVLSNEPETPYLREEVSVQDWRHPELKARWSEFKGVLEQGTEANQLIEFFQTGCLRKEFNALLVAAQSETERSFMQSCRRQLRQRQLKRRRQELTSQIQQAESAQDNARIEALMFEKNSLLKELESTDDR